MANLDCLFYKKLWDFTAFQIFLKEIYSNDELYFFLHLRNQIFEGPELTHLKGVFEIVDLVPYEKCRKILLIQFGGVDDKNIPNYS